MIWTLTKITHANVLLIFSIAFKISNALSYIIKNILFHAWSPSETHSKITTQKIHVVLWAASLFIFSLVLCLIYKWKNPSSILTVSNRLNIRLKYYVRDLLCKTREKKILNFSAQIVSIYFRTIPSFRTVFHTLIALFIWTMHYFFTKTSAKLSMQVVSKYTRVYKIVPLLSVLQWTLGDERYVGGGKWYTCSCVASECDGNVGQEERKKEVSQLLYMIVQLVRIMAGSQVRESNVRSGWSSQ